MGIAQTLAAAGYFVLVIEKQGLASGTSCKSRKLIHRGLRYLESFEFSLVRDSLNERELLLDLAPELVHRKKFLSLFIGKHHDEPGGLASAYWITPC